MRDSISLGRIRGIPVEMKLSALLLLLLLALLMAFAQGLVFGLPIGFGFSSAPWWEKLGMGALCAGVLFLGILLHEVAHSVTAKVKGHEVKSISFVIFGGEADIHEERRFDIMENEELIAFMGPATNLAFGILFLTMSLMLGGKLGSVPDDTMVLAFGVLAFYNLLIGIFNLLPGYPFDGGLILRSYLRKRMDRERTMVTAVKLCRIIALCIGAIGIVTKDLAIILIAVLLFMTAYAEYPDYSFRE